MASPVKDAKLKAQTIWPGAAVHSRGKGWIKHQHPTEPGRVMLDTQVGNRGWHFGDGDFTEANEVDTAWQPGDSAPYRLKMELADYNAYAGIDDEISFDTQVIRYVHPGTGEFVAFQPQELNWRVITATDETLDQIGASQHVAASVDDDTLTWIGAFGTDLDFEWQTQTARLSKRLTIQNSAAIGEPPSWMFGPPWDTGTIYQETSFIFERSSGVRLYVDGELFGEKNKESAITASHIEFRSTATGGLLWYFISPTAQDSSGAEDTSELLLRVRATAQDLFVSVLAPWAWLESATYPVEIDPTIDPQVSANLDDAFEAEATGKTENGTYIRINPTYSWGLWRYTITGPGSGDTVDVAYQRTFCDVNWADDADDIIMYCEDEDDAAAITTGLGNYNISLRDRTEASETWSETGLMPSGEGFSNSPSIVGPVQEVITRGGWASGQHLAVIFNESGSDYRTSQYDLDSAEAAILHIEYTAAGGRTTHNTDPFALGIRAGISRTVNA